jgi:Zn-dependent protease
MLVTLLELFDIVVMTLILGFLFKDVFVPAKRSTDADVLDRYMRPVRKRKGLSDFWFSVAVVAPGVILHELAHKFVAMSFGLQATFHAFYANSTTLFLGVLAIIAKLTGFGFVFLVPGYVSIIGNAPPATYALIAFAGPAVHGLLWLFAILYPRLSRRKLSTRALQFLHLTRYINGFLFILNMLPIPGIDGFAVYSSLLKAI